MTFQQIAYLLLAGIAAAGGQFAVTAAYSHSAGRDISIYDYSQVIFAALLGFIAFGQIPDYLSIIGYFVIFMVTFYMYLQNQPGNSISCVYFYNFILLFFCDFSLIESFFGIII